MPMTVGGATGRRPRRRKTRSSVSLLTGSTRRRAKLGRRPTTGRERQMLDNMLKARCAARSGRQHVIVKIVRQRFVGRRTPCRSGTAASEGSAEPAARRRAGPSAPRGIGCEPVRKACRTPDRHPFSRLDERRSAARRSATWLGTALLSMLAGYKRYAHIAALRGDGELPELTSPPAAMIEPALICAVKNGKFLFRSRNESIFY